MSKPLQVAVFVVAALALSGGGFVAGMNARVAASGAKNAAADASASPSGRRFVAGNGQGGQGQQIAGRVLSVGDNSITLEVRQPGSDQAHSVIALVGGNARILRATETPIKASDIKVGDQVLVVGQTDASTGAVSANAVVVGLNALQQLFGGGQNGGPSASGSGAPRRSPAPTP